VLSEEFFASLGAKGLLQELNIINVIIKNKAIITFIKFLVIFDILLNICSFSMIIQKNKNNYKITCIKIKIILQNARKKYFLNIRIN
jgi:hypothetical protein